MAVESAAADPEPSLLEVAVVFLPVESEEAEPLPSLVAEAVVPTREHRRWQSFAGVVGGGSSPMAC